MQTAAQSKSLPGLAKLLGNIAVAVAVENEMHVCAGFGDCGGRPQPKIGILFRSEPRDRTDDKASSGIPRPRRNSPNTLSWGIATVSGANPLRMTLIFPLISSQPS